MTDEQAGERQAGIHADGDLTVKGRGHKLAGGDIIEAGTYIANAVIQQGASSEPLGLLPPDVADFTGRDAELERLEMELLAAHGQAMLISAVHGKPGVGKSALAIHLAHRLARRFPDGKVYVNLRGADQQPLEVETALTELLHVIGLPPEQHPGTLDGKAALWRQQLAGRHVLVVLDNAHDAGQVRPLLPGSPTCAVIVTSRRVLGTLGAKSLLLDTLDSEEALELLSRIARSERITAEPQAARAIVTSCGGLPLALRIAGARLHAREDWPVAKLADRLADERRRLAELGMDDLDVRASFQLSYQELLDEQAWAFRLLPLWPGADFHPWILQAMLDLDLDLEAAERLVDGLVEEQLVEPASVPGRYRLHDLLRLFAQEQLDHTPQSRPGVAQETAERDEAGNRLLDAAGSFVWILDATLQPAGVRQDPDQDAQLTVPVAVGWLEAERDGLVALVGQVAEDGPWPVAWHLADHLNYFLGLRGYWADRERVDRWALHAARQAGDRAATTRALTSLGNVLDNQGHWQQAIDHYHQSLAICRELGDRHGEATAVAQIGIVLDNQGHWQQATDHYQQVLPVLRELGDRHGEAKTLASLGNVLDRQGYWQQAIDHYHQSLTAYREVGDRHGEAKTLGDLGLALANWGHWQQATDHYHQSLAICRELGDRHGEATTLNNLGLALANARHWQQATDHWQQSLTVCRELGDRYGEAKTLNNLGMALANQGHGQQAIDFYQQSLAIKRELGDRHGEATTLANIGEVLANQRHVQEAIDHCEQALLAFRELGDRLGEAKALVLLGLVVDSQGHRQRAGEHWQAALVIFDQFGAPEAGNVRQLLARLNRPRVRRWWPLGRRHVEPPG